MQTTRINRSKPNTRRFNIFAVAVVKLEFIVQLNLFTGQYLILRLPTQTTALFSLIHRSPHHPTMATIAPATHNAPPGSSPWTSAVLLGPLVPTCLCLATVVLGHFTLLADEDCAGVGGMVPGCSFVRGAVVVSYFEVIIFGWVFMGTTVTMKIGEAQRVAKNEPHTCAIYCEVVACS